MTRSEVNPSEWRAVGYYPEMTEKEAMTRREARLDHQITCAQKYTSICVHWLHNICISALGVFAVAGTIGVLVFIGRLVYFCLST